jgi:hypothetical protein
LDDETQSVSPPQDVLQVEVPQTRPPAQVIADGMTHEPLEQAPWAVDMLPEQLAVPQADVG